MSAKKGFIRSVRIFVAIVIAFVINMVGYQVLTIIFASINGLKGMDSVKVNEALSKDPLFLASTSIISVLIILAMMLLVKKLDKGSLNQLGIKWDKPALRWSIAGGVGAIICVAFLVLISLGSNMYSYVQQKPVFSNNAIMKFGVAYLLVGVLRAFAEEFLFRGYIMKNLNEITGKKGALLISAFLFMLQDAMFNPKPMVIISLMVVGIFFGYMYQTSGSLYFSSVCHSLLHFFLTVVFSIEPNYYGPVAFLFKDNGEKYLFNIPLGTGKDFVFFFTFLLSFIVYYLAYKLIIAKKQKQSIEA